MSQTDSHTTDDTAKDSAQPFWARRARAGLSQLEGMWKEAQKAQEARLRRAAAAAEDLSKSFAATYADTSERLGQLASEARTRGLDLVDRARDLLDLGGRSGGPGAAAESSATETAATETSEAAAEASAAGSGEGEPTEAKAPASADATRTAAAEADAKTDAPEAGAEPKPRPVVEPPAPPAKRAD